MKKFTLMSAIALAFVASTSFAAPTPPASLQALLNKAPNATVQNTFKAPQGLTGWVLKISGKELIVYTSADGKNTFVGSLFDTSGKNLTEAFAEQYGTKINYDKEFSRVEKSSYIVEGAPDDKAVATLYVFKDLNCGYCHQMYKTLEPFKKAGLQVRWMPVSILVPDAPNAPGSLTKGAYALESKDPAKTLNDLHEAFINRKPVNNISASKAAKDKVMKNTELMADLGFNGTPASIIKINGKVRAYPGALNPQAISAATGITLPK